MQLNTSLVQPPRPAAFDQNAQPVPEPHGALPRSSRQRPFCSGRSRPGGFHCWRRFNSGAMRSTEAVQSFDLQYWSMVFPFGMYTAATWALSQQNGLEFLTVIPRVSIWVALASWLLGFAAITRHLSSLLCRGQRSFAHGDAEASL